MEQEVRLVGALAQRYLSSALQQDAGECYAVTADALAGGIAPLVLYLDVIAKTQEIIGKRWEEGEVSIAQEHWATEMAISQIERLRPLLPRRPRIGRRAVIAAVESNLHTLGARMVADFLEMDGWTADFLGANMPADAIIEYSQQKQPALLGLSVALSDQVPAAVRTIEGIRRLSPAPKVLAGGHALTDPASVAALELADGLAVDPMAAVHEARRLAGLQEHRTLDDYLTTLGTRVRRLRLERGWSQQGLGLAANLDRAYISAVERGTQNLTLGAIKRLADALQAPLEALIVPDPGGSGAASPL